MLIFHLLIKTNFSFYFFFSNFLWQYISSFSSSNVDDEGLYYITMENSGVESLTVSMDYYVTTCQYYNEKTSMWDSEGCTAGSTSHRYKSVCECTHLTMFGASVLLPQSTFIFQDITVGGVALIFYF